MSNTHKHKDMIIAKAENMDLVVFTNGTGEWRELPHMPRWGDENYFLCLPQHKDAALHSLNGGTAQAKFRERDFSIVMTSKWMHESWYMNPDCESRIKPRKEKRHLYVSREGATTYAKKTLKEARREVVIMGGSFEIWKHHEIEVEV